MKKFFKPNALNFFLLGLVILLALLGIGFILELFGMDGAQMTLIPLMGIPIILFFISGVYFLVYFFKSISKGSKEVSSFLKANKESYFIVFIKKYWVLLIVLFLLFFSLYKWIDDNTSKTYSSSSIEYKTINEKILEKLDDINSNLIKINKNLDRIRNPRDGSSSLHDKLSEIIRKLEEIRDR
tara:strand:- start:13 stop:561 length:549 start_codon:yes stop_codon:yes gene_type:complete